MVVRWRKRQKPRPARGFQNAEQGLRSFSEMFRTSALAAMVWSEQLRERPQRERRSGPRL